MPEETGEARAKVLRRLIDVHRDAGRGQTRRDQRANEEIHGALVMRSTEQRETARRDVGIGIVDRRGEQGKRARMFHPRENSERRHATPLVARRPMARGVVHQRVEPPTFGEQRDERVEGMLRKI
ncbi:MAG TPA: hypothetical protein VF488_04800, partial [Gemmatimonadaceae bacterium]